jgi:hypothetical protein
MINNLVQKAILQCLAYELCYEFEFFGLEKNRLYKNQYKILLSFNQER